MDVLLVVLHLELMQSFAQSVEINYKISLILLLLCFRIDNDSTIVDTFDMVEVNHYHNECGVDCWSQLICCHFPSPLGNLVRYRSYLPASFER